MKEELHYFSGGDEVFSLDLAGVSWCDGSYHIRRAQSDCWVLEQVVKGTGALLVDGVQYTASAGDIYLLPFGSDHEYFSDAADPWEKIFMNLRGSLPKSLFSLYAMAGNIVFSGCGAEGLFQDFLEMIRRESRPEERLPACALKLHEICMAVHSQYAQPEEPWDAVRIKGYLEQNVSRLVSIRELAEMLGRSEDYVGKQFKKAYGITPYAYLLEQKMELACRLLRNTALPVREIAARLGYEDAHYFSGLFRKAMGVPPSSLRKG